MKKITVTAWVAGLAVAGTVPAATAASTEVAYEATRLLILDGQVKNVDWSGPNLKLKFHSFDGYDGADWDIVGPPLQELYDLGWTRDSLKVGDRNDAVVHPAKDGSRVGSVVRFYLGSGGADGDGETLETSLFGTTQIIPREALNLRFSSSQDDPMYGFYANTQVYWADNSKGFPEENYNGHSWYNADHTLQMFSNDLQADGSWKSHFTHGVWWVEKQQDKWTRCMLFDQATTPYCHSPVNFEKVGDSWTVTLRGRRSDWVEHRKIEAGRH